MGGRDIFVYIVSLYERKYVYVLICKQNSKICSKIKRCWHQMQSWRNRILDSHSKERRSKVLSGFTGLIHKSTEGRSISLLIYKNGVDSKKLMIYIITSNYILLLLLLLLRILLFLYIYIYIYMCISTRKGVVLFPTPRCSSYWCSSYWKESLRLPSTMVANFTYFNLYILITIYLQDWFINLPKGFLFHCLFISLR